jgi:hypothetical protein
VGAEQVVAHRDDLRGGQRGCRVRIQQRRLVHVLPASLQRRAHGQLDDVKEGPVQGRQLRRERADGHRPGAAGAHPAGHLDAALGGQAGDQPAVADVHVDLTLGAGLQRVDELRGKLAGGLEAERCARVQLAPQRGVLAQVLLRPGQIVAHEDAEPLDLAVVAHEPRHVLGGVLAGLGREVAEPAEQLDPDPPLQVRRGVDDLGEPRVQRAATGLEAQHERLVIETRGEEVHRGRVGADEPRQEAVGVPHRVAQAEHVAERGALVHRPGKHGHRVAVVEQVGVLAHLDHVLGDLHDHRDRAQAAEDPADTEGVTDRLPHPVARRDVEVQPGRVVPADLDLVDHVPGVPQRRAPVEMRAHHGTGPGLRGDPAGQDLGVPEPLGADVVQGELQAAAQLGVAAQVGHDVAGELNAAGADERDLDHSSTVSHCGLLRARPRINPHKTSPKGLTPALHAAQ